MGVGCYRDPLDRQDGRKIYTSGELYNGDLLLAESSGIFISVMHTKFAELREAQRERES